MYRPRMYLYLEALFPPLNRSIEVPIADTQGMSVDVVKNMQAQSAALGYPWNLTIWYHPIENWTDTGSLASALEQ